MDQTVRYKIINCKGRRIIQKNDYYILQTSDKLNNKSCTGILNNMYTIHLMIILFNCVNKFYNRRVYR